MKTFLRLKILYSFQPKDFKKNSWSRKVALWLIIIWFENKHQKKIWVKTSPNSKPIRIISWCQIWDQNKQDFEICHLVSQHALKTSLNTFFYAWQFNFFSRFLYHISLHKNCFWTNLKKLNVFCQSELSG